uniref:Uncharacterized protein n=1 Tax=Chromera velia CCMP2878 TaxID=1169474 RepID=A0A0G4H9J7_9ALVE|eukprot:Cvel_25349.t1-p1 / transcript=Cvel_25349.t1 / gene=Cvel_25349 / organism=Chromera_velia_CCMP2878 / gene_product=hypothetical protein / transcript_product=hypothetical protein / location=Cvel_scaffold2859:17935-19804(+) / protein_length=141 / sequence_SO=supercontig / SO=protein_coding / is_pseudo=false
MTHLSRSLSSRPERGQLREKKHSSLPFSSAAPSPPAVAASESAGEIHAVPPPAAAEDRRQKTPEGVHKEETQGALHDLRFWRLLEAPSKMHGLCVGGGALQPSYVCRRDEFIIGAAEAFGASVSVLRSRWSTYGFVAARAP